MSIDSKRRERRNTEKETDLNTELTDAEMEALADEAAAKLEALAAGPTPFDGIVAKEGATPEDVLSDLTEDVPAWKRTLQERGSQATTMLWQETQPPVVPDPNRVREYDIVIVSGQRNYNKPMTVQGMLDRLNPELIIIGDTGATDRMAQYWAKSRGVKFAVVSPRWDELGSAAGPLRNQDVLENVRLEMDENGKSAALVIFHNPRLQGDRAVGSFFEIATEQNDIMAEDFPEMVIPIHDAAQYLDVDMRAAGALSKYGDKYNRDFSDNIRIGANKVDPDRPRTVVRLDN